MTESLEFQKLNFSGTLFTYGGQMKIKKEYREAIISTLKCYNLLEDHINLLEKQIEEIKTNDGVVSVDYSGDGIKTNTINKIVENTALQNIKDLKIINTEINIAQSKLSRLNSAINCLENLETNIIKYKYLNGDSWSSISLNTMYSIRNCKYKLSTAIDKLAIVFYSDRAIEKQSFEI